MCRTRHFLLERTVCHRNSAFKHTTWSTMLSPCKRWRHSDAVRLTRSGFRKKLARALSPPGVGATVIVATKITSPTTIALDSGFNLLLISRILVHSDGNCQHHVIIGINHGYVCVVDIIRGAPSWSPGAARQPTQELMSTTHNYPWLIP